jgi:ubiquinone/menaquinone biosynthesis C-methylase UbiE
MSSLRVLQRNWEALAQSDPMWAICTDSARRDRKWHRDEFFATGQHELGNVMECLQSLGLQVNRNGTALDFGCGVGRLTRAMAAYFPESWGVDISPTMIRLATHYNGDFARCRFVLNENEDLRLFGAGQFDFVYTSIVLQHIAPRHSKRYLEELVRVLKPNGILVFQLLDEFRAGTVARWRQKLGLRRNLRRLTSRANAHWLIDLHCVRERTVRHVMKSAGARVVDVRLTNSAEPSFNGNLRYLDRGPEQGWISKQYCVIKEQSESRKGQRLGN